MLDNGSAASGAESGFDFPEHRIIRAQEIDWGNWVNNPGVERFIRWNYWLCAHHEDAAGYFLAVQTKIQG
jgi:hypothetical protein